MIRIFANLVYFRIIEYLHVKQAVFFSVIFPIFLFVIMTSLWGQVNVDYSNFILTGVIGMIIASEGIFSIGQSVKTFYMSGFIKYIRKMPFSVFFYIMSIIVAKIINLIVIIILMSLIGIMFFNCSMTQIDIVNIFAGLLIGLTIFSFIGLVLHFFNIKQMAEKGIVNVAYLLILFISDVFYSVGDFNNTFKTLGNIFPLNDILDIIRFGEYSWTLVPWCIAPIIIFESA